MEFYYLKLIVVIINYITKYIDARYRIKRLIRIEIMAL